MADMTDADGVLTTAALRVFGVLLVLAAALVLIVTRDPKPEPPPLVRVVITVPSTSTTSPPATSTTSNPPVSSSSTTSTTSTSTPPDPEAPTAADLNDSMPPPSTAPAGGWAATGEQRRTSSTVYCVSGLTYSGGQTHAERPGVGRTAAVNRDNGEWQRYEGTTWRVLDGPHAGAVYTIEDAGTRAHFDQWHGDRADCRDYALGRYGVVDVVLERVVPA